MSICWSCNNALSNDAALSIKVPSPLRSTLTAHIIPLSRCYPLAKLIAMVCLTILVGCATRPERIPAVDVEAAWETHLAKLQQLNTWVIDGRISVQSEDDGWQARVRWRQNNEHYEMDVLDPFGRKVAALVGGPRGVGLTTSKGRSAHAPDPESLMQRMLGYSLPVSGLRYWVRGIPTPLDRAEQIKLDDVGRLAVLKQSGWEVNYQRYQDYVGIELPEKMVLRNKAMKIKMVLNDWRLDTAQ